MQDSENCTENFEIDEKKRINTSSSTFDFVTHHTKTQFIDQMLGAKDWTTEGSWALHRTCPMVPRWTIPLCTCVECLKTQNGALQGSSEDS